jgi:hypothetical protein
LGNKVRPDKRRYLRYEILDYAVVEIEGTENCINTVIADISLGGVQVRSRDPIPVGTTCTVRVAGSTIDPLGLKAEVKHCHAVDGSGLFTTGLKFMPENHTDRLAIADYVHAIFQRQCDNLIV